MSDKIYRLSVVVLLFLILAVQAFGQFYKPTPSEACLEALAQLNGVSKFMQSALEQLPDEYQAEVYDRADNINQQIFLSNEQTFRVLTHVGTMQQTALNVQAVCE